MKKTLLILALALSACASAPLPTPKAASACVPRSMLTSFVTNIWRRPSSDCYFYNGGYACNLPNQFLPYTIIAVPRQVSSPVSVFGDVSACYLNDNNENECFRWFRARCTCGAGCSIESLPENQ